MKSTNENKDSKRNIVQGENNKIYEVGKKLGQGGNGKVFKAKEVNTKFDKYAIKFFSCSRGKEKRKERYNRFQREVEVLKKLKDVNGVINIIDYNLPEFDKLDKEKAWYLMPLCNKYDCSKGKNIIEKLSQMLSLANIIKEIHKEGLAHRDIKPDNILLLNGKIILSDFGLVWVDQDNRLTCIDEKVGPYKILPPELENIQPDMDIDYRKSDVYLFAKVLWIVLKNDPNGFRGRYNRGDKQIYLDKNIYEANTLGYIHKLMEEATDDNPFKRITIEKCIDYIKKQIDILNIKEGDISKEKELNQLLYDESNAEIKSKIEPDELIFRNYESINEILDTMFKVGKVKIKSAGYEEEIQIENYSYEKTGLCVLNLTKVGIFKRSIFCKIKHVKQIKENFESEQEDRYIICLEDFEHNDEYVSYQQSKRDFFSEKIYLSNMEEVIISRG